MTANYSAHMIRKSIPPPEHEDPHNLIPGMGGKGLKKKFISVSKLLTNVMEKNSIVKKVKKNKNRAQAEIQQ